MMTNKLAETLTIIKSKHSVVGGHCLMVRSSAKTHGPGVLWGVYFKTMPTYDFPYTPNSMVTDWPGSLLLSEHVDSSAGSRASNIYQYIEPEVQRSGLDRQVIKLIIGWWFRNKNVNLPGYPAQSDHNHSMEIIAETKLKKLSTLLWERTSTVEHSAYKLEKGFGNCSWFRLAQYCLRIRIAV